MQHWSLKMKVLNWLSVIAALAPLAFDLHITEGKSQVPHLNMWSGSDWETQPQGPMGH